MTFVRPVVPGEYYHVFNRAAFKTGVFHDQSDWARFMFYLIYFQSPTLFPQPGRIVRSFSTKEGFELPEQQFMNVIGGRTVELVSFCVMQNHFHLLVRELAEGGIARYMQRVELAYTKYFNTKYEATGHVFQGRYKSVHVKDNRQLLYLSSYIHRNPHELKAWRGKEAEYPWSSLYDYVTANRWGGLLAQEIILDQFDGSKNSNYADFVRSSTAKILEDELKDLI
jgi:putative transposase